MKNRGVEDPERLLSVGEHEVLDGMTLKNMKEGLELLNKHLKRGSRIHVQTDSDCDGFMSAATIIDYIRNVNPKATVTYTLHKGKEHGIELELIKDYEYDLLIIPDAGTNDVNECKILKSQGKDILIIDHHEIEVDNPYAIIINCMDGQYQNPHLSGSAMVYKYCKEYDKKFGYSFADRYLDLVAVGTIGDMMDLRSFETRYLVLAGIEMIGQSNEFLKEIMEQNEYQIQGKPSITKVGWYIAPYFNACIRSGTAEEKLDTFKALLGEKETREYTPRKTKENPDPQPEKQTLQKYMSRILKNIKGRQDREVKKCVDKLVLEVVEQEKISDKMLILNSSENIPSNYSGLIANKIASQYKRPVLILRKDERHKDQFGGSGRNYGLFPIDDLRQFLLDLNLFEFVSGHSNAFGVGIKSDKIDEAQQRVNEALKDVPLEDVYHVDYEISVGRLKIKDIKRIAEWEDMWGGTLEEPMFAITNIYIPTENIQLLGERKNFIRFESKGITFIKRFANEDEYNRMTLRQTKGLNKKRPKSVKIDVVGKFRIHEWNDLKTPQVEIVDFNAVEGGSYVF